MSDNNTLNKLTDIITDKLGVDKEKVTNNARFIEDLGYPSWDESENQAYKLFLGAQSV